MRYTYSEKFLSLITEPVLLEFNMVVGGTGAVGAIAGSGIESIERLGAGIYRINLDRAYNRLLSAQFNIEAGVTGGAVTAGSFNPTTLYQIVTVGTTDYTLVGAKVNEVGEAFVATGAGTGTGTAKAVLPSQAVSVQLVSNVPNACSHLVIQCIDDAGAAVEIEQTCKLRGLLLMRKSSVAGEGES